MVRLAFFCLFWFSSEDLWKNFRTHIMIWWTSYLPITIYQSKNYLFKQDFFFRTDKKLHIIRLYIENCVYLKKNLTYLWEKITLVVKTFLISLEQFIRTAKCQNIFWKRILVTGGFYKSNTLEQLKCKLEQIPM